MTTDRSRCVMYRYVASQRRSRQVELEVEGRAVGALIGVAGADVCAYVRSSLAPACRHGGGSDAQRRVSALSDFGDLPGEKGH